MATWVLTVVCVVCVRAVLTGTTPRLHCLYCEGVIEGVMRGAVRVMRGAVRV